MVNDEPEIRSLDRPDASRPVPHGRIDFVELGGIAYDRATFEPGWRWSDHATGASCAERHVGYLVSGCMRFRMDDGTEHEARAGDVYSIPPGHDAWVVGDEPCVALDLRAGPAVSSRRAAPARARTARARRGSEGGASA